MPDSNNGTGATNGVAAPQQRGSYPTPELGAGGAGAPVPDPAAPNGQRRAQSAPPQYAVQYQYPFVPPPAYPNQQQVQATYADSASLTEQQDQALLTQRLGDGQIRTVRHLRKKVGWVSAISIVYMVVVSLVYYSELRSMFRRYMRHMGSDTDADAGKKQAEGAAGAVVMNGLLAWVAVVCLFALCVPGVCGLIGGAWRLQRCSLFSYSCCNCCSVLCILITLVGLGMQNAQLHVMDAFLVSCSPTSACCGEVELEPVSGSAGMESDDGPPRQRVIECDARTGLPKYERDMPAYQDCVLAAVPSFEPALPFGPSMATAAEHTDGPVPDGWGRHVGDDLVAAHNEKYSHGGGGQRQGTAWRPRRKHEGEIRDAAYQVPVTEEFVLGVFRGMVRAFTTIVGVGERTDELPGSTSLSNSRTLATLLESGWSSAPDSQGDSALGTAPLIRTLYEPHGTSAEQQLAMGQAAQQAGHINVGMSGPNPMQLRKDVQAAQMLDHRHHEHGDHSHSFSPRRACLPIMTLAVQCVDFPVFWSDARVRAAPAIGSPGGGFVNRTAPADVRWHQGARWLMAELGNQTIADVAGQFKVEECWAAGQKLARSDDYRPSYPVGDSGKARLPLDGSWWGDSKKHRGRHPEHRVRDERIFDWQDSLPRCLSARLQEEVHERWQQQLDEVARSEMSAVENSQAAATPDAAAKNCRVRHEVIPQLSRNLKQVETAYKVSKRVSGLWIIVFAIPMLILGLLQCCWGCRLYSVTTEIHSAGLDSELERYRLLLDAPVAGGVANARPGSSE